MNVLETLNMKCSITVRVVVVAIHMIIYIVTLVGTIDLKLFIS